MTTMIILLTNNRNVSHHFENAMSTILTFISTHYRLANEFIKHSYDDDFIE